MWSANETGDGRLFAEDSLVPKNLLLYRLKVVELLTFRISALTSHHEPVGQKTFIDRAKRTCDNDWQVFQSCRIHDAFYSLVSRRCPADGGNVRERRKFYLNLLALLILSLSTCAVNTSAQSFPVYVSAGPTIYALSGGNSTVVATLAGANFESLAIGPDNTDLGASGNAVHPFLLYACDTANKAIYRLDPTVANVTLQQVYSGAITPNCGRFSATGDLYVTNKSGAGIYRISCPACANVAFPGNALGATAVAVNGSFPTSGRGITQKYSGDLLAVDNTGKVLRFPYGSFGTNKQFASTELSAPIGVARISNGDVFVSNSNLVSGKTTVAPVIHYDPTGALANNCAELTLPKNSKETPAYLATTSVATASNTKVNDTVFLVANATSGSTLYSWTNTTGAACGLTAVASVKAVLTGIAVAPAGAGPAAPPAVTLSLPVQSSGANPKAVPFNFNSNQFQLIATGCTAQVTAYPLSPATVQAMIARAATGGFNFDNPATPSVNLGEDGYQIVYVGHWLFGPNPPNPQSCTPVGSDFVVYLASVVDASQFINPRMLQCDNNAPNSEPTLSLDTICGSDQMIAIYPLGGPIPKDGVSGATTRTTNSVFALVNESTQGSPGTFCGFQTPLKNTLDPKTAASFNPTQKNTLAVKFKLAQAGGSCQNGPYVTNAEALISVARIVDSNGVDVFDPINPNPTASSIDTPPLFNAGNQQYSFTLTIKDYLPGTYSLTVTFLSDNQTNQTIVFNIQ